ncbi:hypothetical protein, partial [Escherichia coli]|uniref:hypothetical protein n=1 Tax=Escherichia coli TaxID=562 RepID=UPI00259CDEEA
FSHLHSVALVFPTIYFGFTVGRTHKYKTLYSSAALSVYKRQLVITSGAEFTKEKYPISHNAIKYAIL